jgi:3-oxoacyl-[acyl-carrier protein] reductase
MPSYFLPKVWTQRQLSTDSGTVEMNSNSELAGRVAIVTGAGRNIGRQIAQSLAASGAAVTVNVRSNREEAERVVREINLAGREALAFVADVAEPQMVQTMVVATAECFGRIDILVNNAALRAEQALSEMTLEQWRAVTAVILDGAFNCVKACLPYLQKSGDGVIVNIGGLSALTGAKRRPAPSPRGWQRSREPSSPPRGILYRFHIRLTSQCMGTM